MRLTQSRRHNTPSETVDEVLDIDVTPVMNMFVVLIPFLVSMAVFAHFSAHKLYLPSSANNANDSDNQKLKFKTTVLVDAEYLLVTVGDSLIDSIDVNSIESSLSDALFRAKSIASDTTTAVISVKDSIAFEKAIVAMDYCRNAGFESLGLTSAPEKLQ